MDSVDDRLARIDWERVISQLDEQGCCRLPRILAASECRALISLYRRESPFRSTVDMERHRFGRGQYRYFARPLPPLVEALRRSFYARLHPLANAWAKRLGRAAEYPAALDDYLARCHAAGQSRPTPLLLHYAQEDFNCLHQDVYGALRFPLQVLIVLSQPGRDYQGGEVVFVEQRPRQQSRAFVFSPARGEAVVFTNRERPVRGARADYAVQMRHGASPVLRGHRYVLGLIFHDAA